jgi:glyoxylase-like metal-dependent hydrolase (beta-lactamase superfamily II)
MTLATYEVFAIKYAERDARRTNHFLGGDPHDGPMPMDYFVWLIRNDQRTIVLDVGFTAQVAERRKRVHLRLPAAGLAKLGVNAATVRDVVVSHMHYDHIGTSHDFPQARFHLQDDELAFVTGRPMCHHHMRHSYEVEDVVGVVRMLFEDRVQFHDGDDELAPGVTLHRIGGHTIGLQSVRVHTKRGWVVLASDASHYYEHFEKGRVFPTVYNVAETLEGYDKLRRLAESPQHIVPGHDPLVMARYPAVSRELEGIAVRLDTMPEHDT